MNPNRFAFLGVLMILSSFTLAQPANVDDLIKQLSGDAPLAATTPAQLDAVYAAVMPRLLEQPEADDSALQKIVFRAGRPPAEAERAALSKALCAKLTASATVPLKVMLLRHIQRIGRDEAVPAVAALLADPDAQVRECARRTLEANPSRAAASVLIEAIAKATDPAWKAALIAALEFRRDPADAPVFAKYAADEDDTVRAPALLALARTGDASAIPLLTAAQSKGSDAAKQVADDALLLLADRLIAIHKPAAAKIYRQFTTAPAPQRYAGIVGLGAAGAPDDFFALVDLLADKDIQTRGAALGVLAKHPDAKIAELIIQKLKTGDASAKPWLLRALAAQGARKHAALFTTAAADADEVVRVQALKILAEAGDASALPVLLKSAQARGDEQAAARAALELIPGADLDNALVPLIDTGDAAQRIEVIRAAGARNIKAAVPALLKATQDSDRAIRAEAHKSLALAGDSAIVPQMITAISATKDDAERDLIGRTLAAILRKSEAADRVAPVVAAAEKADGPARTTYYSVLGQVGGEVSLAALLAATKNTDDKTRESAVRALSTWADATPAAELLKIAHTEKKDTTAILALRGHIRMIGLSNNRKPAAEQIQAYTNALAATRRPDEKRQIIGGLGDLRDAKALAALAPFLDAPDTANEAASAILRVCNTQAERDAVRANQLLTRIAAITKNESQKKQAQELMGRLDQWFKKNPQQDLNK